ncbi:hypothetical protein GCM10009578_021720 [Streptomyces rhizosphaericus]
MATMHIATAAGTDHRRTKAHAEMKSVRHAPIRKKYAWRRRAYMCPAYVRDRRTDRRKALAPTDESPRTDRRRAAPRRGVQPRGAALRP